jgi:WD40 repeat protein
MLWTIPDWISRVEKGFGSVAYSRDGNLLALGGGASIKFIDPATQREIRTFKLPQITWAEAGLPPSATISRDGTKVDSSKDTTNPTLITALAFSPGGRQLAAGCVDGTVRLTTVAGK